MNQAVSFGLLGGGGILLTKALTGSSFSDVVKGHPGKVPDQGPTLTASVAGVGSAIAGGAASTATGITAAGKGAAASINSAGYTNPLPHATVGRTDQGVDANIPVGAPILAIGKSQVVGILQNWYAGQPFVWLKLLDGPQAGKYWYVAEQITPAVTPGQIVNAGDPVGHYAASGSGLELGWATSSGQTLARATTGYTEGQVTPAGQSFRSFLTGLGI